MQGWGTAWAASAMVVALALTAAVPALTSRIARGPDGPSAAQQGLDMASANKAAVLAWAKANCFSGIELNANAPRTQMETILQVAASYDSESRRRGIGDVCAEALAATHSITAPGSAPAITGERPLYEPNAAER